MPVLTKEIKNYTINGKMCITSKKLNFKYPLCKATDITVHDLKLLAPHSKTIKCKCKCDQCDNEYNIALQSLTLQEIDSDYILCNYCKGKITRSKRTEEEKQQIKEKIKRTNDQKTEEEKQQIKEKREKTVLQRYGYRTVFEVPEIKTKIQQTNDNKTEEEKQQIRNKVKHTIRQKYGVDNVSQSPIIREQVKQTNLLHYGVEYSTQSPIVKEKIKNTNIERYGVTSTFSASVIRKKIEQTNIERYGNRNVFATPIIQERIKQTNLTRYGHEYIGSVPEIITKRIQTFNVKTEQEKQSIYSRVMNSRYNNHSVASSAQQKYFYSIFGGELNYPFSTLALDIALVNEKIDIEYNGGGHDLSVKIGKCTINEFNQHEIKRNKFIRSLGWKQIIFISPNDKIDLYSDIEYNKILNFAKTFLLNTNHHWINIYIEDNKIETAVYTQTIAYILSI